MVRRPEATSSAVRERILGKLATRYSNGMKRSHNDWTGTLVWLLLGLGALFVGTKHLWFDGLTKSEKALFWTTLLGPVVAAIGWYVAASENFRRSRELEADKNERERRGAIRRINLLLRGAVHGLDSFFWAFKPLQLDSALTTWTQLRDLLQDPAAATALNNADYRARRLLVAPRANDCSGSG